MNDAAATFILGLPLPSSSPAFLALVGIHILFGLTAVVGGAGAIVARKGSRRHRRFGMVYIRALGGVAVTMAMLASLRWTADWPLFLLGALSFLTAIGGRMAARRHWVRSHLGAMTASYVLLLTAFYVDNGPNLPLWRALPTLALWLLPATVALPFTLYALLRHPVVRREDRTEND